MSPLGLPNAALVIAVERAGGLGVLDLGTDPVSARDQLAVVERRLGRHFGVRIGAGCPLTAAELPGLVDTIVVPHHVPAPGRRVLVEVTSVGEARDAVLAGADGLIARGCEAGGRVGELTTFVLLQRLLAEFDVPVWAAGGIGPHTAAAAVAGGAHGVVLDSQLALVREVRDCLPAGVATAIAAMDGADTIVEEGHRILSRPGLDSTPPVGQDGALARSLAHNGVTAGGVLQIIRKAVRNNLRAAAANPPLRPGGTFCERNPGPRYPLAQGPMTRVSDQPAFAEAVADAGGLPFLALALMDGAQTRKLLDATDQRLGERPWGVGVLGFADPEIRQAQLEAVHAVRPRYAIVAGGNPAQARDLEQSGISAFLHVPSPALLSRFLDEGARKFVFEGWECGGHTGPRSSFTLWEQQVEVLLAQPSLDEVSVLFAGGIHDERSAAMVSALSARLADRGAAVGALMGTAYLFTTEAVEHGAILPVFQQVAVECEQTVLLETSPGHSVRCADTSYVDTFSAARERLSADGVTRQDAWAELERLNLGRLRIASRGLRRSGDVLERVGEDEQRADGMFMIGQVATLRRELTDIASLHEQVCRTGLLTARHGELTEDEEPTSAEPLDIAIVGMAAMLPGAGDVASYWANIVAGVDAVTEVPADRWDPERYPESPSRWGGFLSPVGFDPLAYGIPPASLTSIEPAQLLALEAAARALSDAGYAHREFDRDRASVIFGAEAGADLANAYTVRSALPALHGSTPPELDEFLPRLTEDSFPGVLGNVISGRIANRLDLGGANYTVDAACASSLAALDVACKELTAGSSDLVLCGAVDLHNSAHDYLMFASVGALSASGRCATFDSSADGIALGEGVACVVLKRLADAERDGDRVYAVIKGIGSSSDGRSLGLTAPRADGQRRALHRAYGEAGVPVGAVGLVEAHGTGTVVGDRTELAALTEMFAGLPAGSCTIGSVKSQIGHTKCTAGLAGMIKAATAVHTGIRPGTLHVSEPNAFWDRQTSPFAFGSRTWSAPAGRRVAGISAFGFGGTNFHAVISGYDGAEEPRHGLREWPAELFVFRGETADAARKSAQRLARLVRANDDAGRPLPLRALAATAAAGGQPIQATAVVASLDELPAVLDAVGAWRASDGVRLRETTGEPAVAFLYPGQGSQRPGMLLDLFTAFPRLQSCLRLAGGRYEDVMFPPAPLDEAEAARQRAAITDTTVAQPTLGIAGLAATELLASLGVRPSLAGGHSYGELVALASAGVFSPERLIALSAARADAIVAAAGEDPGAMAAVSAAVDSVLPLLPSGVVVANHNSPRQVVISGPTAAVAEATEALKAAGLSVRALPVAAAFHSPVVAAAATAFAGVLDSEDLGEPAFPVWSNRDAAPYGAEIREPLAGQLGSGVRFVEQIESMYAAGARVFVEAGPGGVLTSFVRKTLGDRPHTAVRLDAPGEPGIPALLDALGALAAAGVPLDTGALFTGRADPVQPEEIPAKPQWYVDGGLVRDSAGNALPGGLRPATEAPRPLAGGAAALSRDQVVKEYLDGMREAVAAQRDVLLGYLGSAPAAPPPAPVVVEQPAPVVVEAGPAPVADVGSLILDTISARTGYPADMLDPGLDLEADLSIDSIKRTEIIGELATTLGITGDTTTIETLAKIKTIAGIVDWFGQRSTAAPAPAKPGVDVGTLVLDTISARTGYPAEMLDPGLDLEADLSIDSIKRTEIIGELATTLGITGDTTTIETLAKIKTIAGIVDWFGTGPAEPTEPVTVPAGEPAPEAGGARPSRQVPELVTLTPCPPTPADALAGRSVLIVDNGDDIGLEVADLVERFGGTPRNTRELTGPVTGADHVIHLGGLRAEENQTLLPGVYAEIRACLAEGVRGLVVATAGGGTFGFSRTTASPDLGMHGLIRTAAREYPDVHVRAVDVDPKDSHRQIAGALVTELTTVDGPAVVGHTQGVRHAIELRPAELDGTGELALDADGVVLLTGGARGITALVARELARRTGCRIELIGRTPLPRGPEDPRTAAAPDEPSIRRALAESGVRDLDEVARRSRALLAEREIRATMDALRETASSVRYHACDVADTAAVHAVIADITARFGRLDGVVHGAGILDDKLMADKTQEAFARVYDTKVGGALALEAALEHDPAFLVLFGSISGVFGNRGQADYSAANDTLDRLARLWATRTSARVLSVDWGPWAGSGMAADLAAEYARRGIRLIDPVEGVDCLLAEIATGRDVQVVYQCEG
ncbi:type I polyketide synthase [Amycolatopsis suaedae]|uniref:type I polyketide synthase n=1 Tax=Amycolatopsis suaedae TaxID=2510978 RepID=UPI001F10D474|nr:type I polyketide synthase [Amycolatopsis suaedae]